MFQNCVSFYLSNFVKAVTCGSLYSWFGSYTFVPRKFFKYIQKRVRVFLVSILTSYMLSRIQFSKDKNFSKQETFEDVSLSKPYTYNPKTI